MADYNGMEALLASTENLTQLLNNVGHDDDTLTFTGVDWFKFNGVMVHSTGANNPNLKRYVGPDDGLLGVNQYGNHWNTATPGGSQVCVHAFIGKLKDGSIATYQTLPWNMQGWHGR